MSWCTIESDPGVFTELVRAFGVPDVQVEELWSLDEDSFAALRPVHGLFFLFKWQKDKGRRSNPDTSAEGVGSTDVFFCNQTINNACGTIALLHVLLNNTDVKLGPTLQQFKTSALEFPPDLRGLVLEPFEIEEQTASEDDDVYHFIAYTPHEGRVYEIDGLTSGPVEIGSIPAGASWTSVAAPAISSRIAEYSTSEIHFNLLALVGDRLLAAAQTASALVEEAIVKYADLQALGCYTSDLHSPMALASMLGVELPSSGAASGAASAEEARAQYIALQEQAEQVAASISTEKERREKWRVENERRRHNFVPFIVELLKQLSTLGKLQELFEAGKKKTAELRERTRKSKLAATEHE